MVHLHTQPLMAPENRAAWLEKGEPSPPLTVGPAPYPVCGPDEVIVENKAVAVYAVLYYS